MLAASIGETNGVAHPLPKVHRLDDQFQNTLDSWLLPGFFRLDRKSVV